MNTTTPASTPLPVALTQRKPSGFWRTLPRLVGRRAQVLRWPDLGVRARVFTGRNLADSYRGRIFVREVDVLLYRGNTRKPIGVAKFHVVGSCCGLPDEESFFDAADEASESALNLVENLHEAFGALDEVFGATEAVADFDRLEFLPESGLKGHGAEIGRRLMDYIEEQFGAHLFSLTPFPLQFELVAPDRAVGSADVTGFERARTKLKELYSRAWDAVAIGDWQMYCTSQTLQRSSSGWSLGY